KDHGVRMRKRIDDVGALFAQHARQPQEAQRIETMTENSIIHGNSHLVQRRLEISDLLETTHGKMKPLSVRMCQVLDEHPLLAAHVELIVENQNAAHHSLTPAPHRSRHNSNASRNHTCSAERPLPS